MTEILKKMIPLLALLLLSLTLFGCTGQNDAKSLKDFNELKLRYGVSDAFSTDIDLMNNYLIDLASLRAKSSGSAAKILDAELSSAQTFYYLASALSASTSVDYTTPACSSKEIKTLKDYTKLSISSADKAINQISSLSTEEQKNLRPNQLEMMKGYKERAQQVDEYLRKIC